MKITGYAKYFASSANRGNSRGFSMVEVMVAAWVLAIGLLAVAGMHVSASKGNNTAERMSVASAIAWAKIAELKASTYFLDISHSPDPLHPNVVLDQPNSILTAGEYPLAGDPQWVKANGLPCPNADEVCLFKIHWVITDEPQNQTSMDSKKLVSIDVSWKDPESATGLSKISMTQVTITPKFK